MVPFRDAEVEIVIERFIEEPDVNYFDVEWHFADHGLNTTRLTEIEEGLIRDHCWNYRYDPIEPVSFPLPDIEPPFPSSPDGKSSD
jgi:hypothetical protein